MNAVETSLKTKGGGYKTSGKSCTIRKRFRHNFIFSWKPFPCPHIPSPNGLGMRVFKRFWMIVLKKLIIHNSVG